MAGSRDGSSGFERLDQGTEDSGRDLTGQRGTRLLHVHSRRERMSSVKSSKQLQQRLLDAPALSLRRAERRSIEHEDTDHPGLLEPSAKFFLCEVQPLLQLAHRYRELSALGEKGVHQVVPLRPMKRCERRLQVRISSLVLR